MRHALRALADRAGILSEYIDQTGRERRVTSDETRVAILEAMGLPATSDERAARSLAMLEERDRARRLAPVRVVVHGAPIEAPAGAALVLESGEEADPATAVPLGYHTLSLGGDTQTLIVVPPRAMLPHHAMMGIVVNLYAVRSARNWGVGDLGDLAALAHWSAAHGAAFVGVNPLHAHRNRDPDISPYSPVSRVFRNPIYLDIEQVPELRDAPHVRALIAQPDVQAELRALRAAEQVHYARVWALKTRVLAPLFERFLAEHRDRDTARGRAFDAYVAREGAPLEAFALWSALDAHFRAGTEHARPWWMWPPAFHDPASPECAAFRLAHRDEIDWHRWLQFELDRQLALAADAARAAGQSLGIYQDLAIGASAAGSDVWANQRLYLRAISLGAPPDMYAAQGQNWGLPPMDPLALREARYAPFIALVRAALAHAGALRMDHVLGLFRQFWIPQGMSGADGAYVRFPTEELFGILALESVRHRAVIVGEDLGTVPPEVPEVMRRWGVLGSRVMHFERTAHGDFGAAAAYEPLALATAGTHDLVPLRGWWEGRDIDLRRRVGLLTSDEAERQERDARARDRERLLERLRADGTLDADSERALVPAVHRFLCRTPSMLVGLALDDLVGEREPVNIPGVGPEAFPCWTRRLGVAVEELDAHAGVQRALACPRGTTTM